MSGLEYWTTLQKERYLAGVDIYRGVIPWKAHEGPQRGEPGVNREDTA